MSACFSSLVGFCPGQDAPGTAGRPTIPPLFLCAPRRAASGQGSSWPPDAWCREQRAPVSSSTSQHLGDMFPSTSCCGVRGVSLLMTACVNHCADRCWPLSGGAGAGAAGRWRGGRSVSFRFRRIVIGAFLLQRLARPLARGGGGGVPPRSRVRAHPRPGDVPNGRTLRQAPTPFHAARWYACPVSP